MKRSGETVTVIKAVRIQDASLFRPLTNYPFNEDRVPQVLKNSLSASEKSVFQGLMEVKETAGK